MMRPRPDSRLILVIVTALLVVEYIFVVIAKPDPFSSWLMVSSLACAVWFGLVSGRLIALSVGLFLGLFSSWQLYFSSIVFLPPVIIYGVLHPVLALSLAQYAGRFRQEYEKQKHVTKNLTAQNLLLKQKLLDQEEMFHNLKDQPVYRSTFRENLLSDSEQELILGLFLDSAFDLIHESRQQQIFQPEARSSSDEQLFFHFLLQIRPDLLAILDLHGSILVFNPCLMGILGYFANQSIKGRSFLDFLASHEVLPAAQQINQALQDGLDPTKTYAIRCGSGSFKTLPVCSQVYFACMGNPLVIAVFIKQISKSIGQTQPPLARLVHGSTVCLAANGTILYVAQEVAHILGEEPRNIIGKPFLRYVSSFISDETESLNQLKSGNTVSTDLIMQPRGDHHVVFHATIYPALSDQDQFMGATLELEDITKIKETEAVLLHRLKIDEVITDVSKRFVSVSTDEIDQAIEDVLRKICEMEDIAECAIFVFPSETIQNPICYRARSVSDSSENGHDKGYGSEADYENISVPITLANERPGCFHFSLPKYQGSWLESDLKLICLIGEIIINALKRKENEMVLYLNEKRLFTTLQSIGDAVISTDISDRIISMNQSAERLTGWSFEEAQQKPLTMVMNTSLPIRINHQSSSLSEPLNYSDESEDNSIRLWSRDGKDYYITVSCSLIEDQSGSVYGKVIIFRDVTFEKQKADQIRYISYHDNLTDLYNRAFFVEELRRLNVQRQYPLTLIMGDCDGLKLTNDIFGHQEGDRLLISIAHILKQATRKEDIVARWGGDEFVIILPQTDEASSEAVKERIIDLCNHSEATPIRPSLSLGSATHSDGTCDIEGLLKLAEDRMYQHKLLKGNIYSTFLQSVLDILYKKSDETEEHIKRLQKIAHLWSPAIALNKSEEEDLIRLALLHDIGKIYIPDHVFQKSDRLTQEEWEMVKKHPEKGYQIAKSFPEFSGIAQSVLCHHEHWDGSGYPGGLEGEKIPKLARIFTIIDAFDTMTHHRAHQDKRNQQEALAEINRFAGTQFDPELASSFVAILEGMPETAEHSA